MGRGGEEGEGIRCGCVHIYTVECRPLRNAEIDRFQFQFPYKVPTTSHLAKAHHFLLKILCDHA